MPNAHHHDDKKLFGATLKHLLISLLLFSFCVYKPLSHYLYFLWKVFIFIGKEQKIRSFYKFNSEWGIIFFFFNMWVVVGGFIFSSKVFFLLSNLIGAKYYIVLEKLTVRHTRFWTFYNLKLSKKKKNVLRSMSVQPSARPVLRISPKRLLLFFKEKIKQQTGLRGNREMRMNNYLKWVNKFYLIQKA